jgi:ABC-type bacteriocin/lantibiotic exporter with double-glycine peptidase domain
MRKAHRTGVRQRDTTDCGPACIASVMAHYRQRIPVSRVRQVAGTDRQGTSMLGMVQALEQLNFKARGLKGNADHLVKLPRPFIAHTVRPDGMHHYVTVFGINRRGLRIMDPSLGKIRLWTHGAFREQWTGSVIAMVPGTGEEKPGAYMSNRTRLYSLLTPVWKPLLQALISAILYTLLGLSSSIYLGKLTDHVFVTHNVGLLNLMSLVMLWITLLMIYLSVSKNITMLKTGQVIDNQLIISYFRHLFNLPQRFFDTMKTGEIISRVNDAVKIRGFINDAAIGITVNLLILLFSFVTMFLLHPKLAFMMVAMIPLYALIYVLFNHSNRKIEREVMERSASLEDLFVESLRASTHIRQYNLEPLNQQRAEQKLNRLLDTVYRSGINSIVAAGSTETVNRLFIIILLWLGSFFVIGGSLTAGQLLTFYALMGYFTGPVNGLIGANKTYQNALIAADRLFEIFHLELEQSPGKPSFRREQFGDVVFHGVSFAYGTRGILLEQLDLTIREGEITAITGASGSGKSTIASLVQQLYPVDSGHITINGCDARYFSKESIRSLIGVVPQQISFLSGSFLENIAPGDKDPDLGRITNLLREVGLLPFIGSLPEGLETIITGNGGNLSGGERQRLALVRALYRDPALLILDEATSSLDPVSEVYINRVLLGLKEQSQAILLITHKSQYASLADHIYEIENGRTRTARKGISQELGMDGKQ